MENVFFNSWESSLRTVILTILGYVAVVLILRISGKRTLSKMNAFDFVVTVALGSCLATISLSKNVSLVDGVLSFSLFIFMQYLFTLLSVRIKGFRNLITSQPVMVFYEGEFLELEMKKHRLAKEEILYSCRLSGYSILDDIHLIILETTGELSIIKKFHNGEISSTSDLSNS